jgi:tripartite-type tricarboxylate transporter receptor subunit TctC
MPLKLIKPLLFSLHLFCLSSAFGQTLFVPFAQGSTTDALARAIATEMGDDTVKAVINILGNDGRSGLDTFLQTSSEEGNLLLMNARLFHALVSADESALDKLYPIGLIGLSPLVLIAPFDNSNWEAVLTKVRSGRLKIFSSNRNSPSYICAATLAKKTGTNVSELNGESLTVASVIGQEGVACISAGAAIPTARMKLTKIHATAVDNSGLAALSGIPNTASLGLQDLPLGDWQILVSLRELPKALKIATKNKLQKALAQPSIKARAANTGYDMAPSHLTDSDLRGFVARDYKLIKSQ